MIINLIERLSAWVLDSLFLKGCSIDRECIDYLNL